SEDGGKTFSTLMGGNHPDHHALWVSPKNPDQLLIGTDGGVYSSNDRGSTWNFVRALPVSQFYHVSYDMEDPYNVYGGLQDNGTWYGPSRAPAGIQNRHWRNIGSGDGFAAHVDRGDPNIVYVEWQGGRIQRVNKKTGEAKDIQPLPQEGDPKLRFNWNTPIQVSPNRTDTIYIGAQFLFRSRDRGESWEKISPDLTTNDPDKQRQIDSGGLTPDNSTAENHCTIYTISESPRDENVIWVGTDDGNVQVTRDGGRTWTNVTDNIPGASPDKWVTSVEASHHADGTAYVTLDAHRVGDLTPYVFKTTDFGRTWTPLATDQIEGYALVIREDLVKPNLLFLGTEFGLYISLDGGENWARFKNNLPKVGVRDLAIHPREHDLIIATHGRGIYILDDITPLRHLTKEVLASPVAMLPTRPVQMRIPAGVQEFPGNDEFVGSSAPGGAPIVYYLKKRQLFGEMKVEVLDKEGNVLASLPGTNRRGLNVVRWSMRKKPPKIPPAASLVPQQFAMFGPQVGEGTYRVRLHKGEDVYEGTITAVMDPRADYTAEGRALQDRTVTRLYEMLQRLTYLVDTILDVQKQGRDRAEKAKDDKALVKSVTDLVDDLEALRKTLVATRKGGFLAGEEQLREKLGSLYGAVNGYEGRPTQSQLGYMEVLDKQLQEAERKAERLLTGRLDDINRRLRAAGLAPLHRMTRDEWDKRQQR
ncbi:MAG: glycosyl hydrolase, partial [Planctomycetota bacterium]